MLLSGNNFFISDERKLQLEKIGFQGNYRKYLALTMPWNEEISELMEFKQQWSHYDVTLKYAKDSNIWRWVNQQSNQYILLKSDKKYFISDTSIEQQEKLVFQWNPESQFEITMAWNKWLSEIMEIKQWWGNCDVTQTYAKNPRLGQWVSNQRN